MKDSDLKIYKKGTKNNIMKILKIKLFIMHKDMQIYLYIAFFLVFFTFKITLPLLK